MGAVLLGTSSWSEPSWVGPFYPEGTKPGDFLAHYAQRFRTVEADNTYYRVPDKRLVSGWNAKTPEGFLLSAKFPRSIVHGGDEATPNPDVLLVPKHVGLDTERFMDAMAALGKKCGPLVLQFPYFNKKAFASPGPFLERLDAFLGAMPKRFRFGVEVRNHAWIGKPLLDVLRRHNVTLVLVAYARLIGDRKAVEEKTKTFDRVVLDKSESLDEWAKLIETLSERVRETYVYVNNHYAGHAPATIEELARRLRG